MDTRVAAVNSINGGASERTARLGKGGMIGVAVIALVAALVASQVLTHGPAIGRDVTTTTLPTSLSSQDFIQQQRYREASTTAADTVASYRMINGGADAFMPMMSEQQRTLEASTTAAATVPNYRTFNGAVPSTRECTHPVVGFPTCYVQQADGSWAREELADLDSTLVVVGTVTPDEAKAAVAEPNAVGA
jgi:hypothetical protein